MKELVLKLLLIVATSFAIVVLIIYTATTFGYYSWLPNIKSTTGGYGNMLLRMREAQQVSDVDILFVGSSHVYRGFNPLYFSESGIKTFNIGSSAQTPFNSYFLLKDYLKNIKPKYVVLDLFWHGLSSEGVEANLDIISNSKITGNTVQMAIESADFQVLNTLIFTWVNRFKYPIHKISQKSNSFDYYISGGYTETELKVNRLTESELHQLTFNKSKINVNYRQLYYLNKLIRLCELQEVKLLLIITPVTKEFLKSISNYNKYKLVISEIAKSHKVPFIDYNDRNGLLLSSFDDFYDEHHLTKSGVAKFNKVFIIDFKELIKSNRL